MEGVEEGGAGGGGWEAMLQQLERDSYLAVLRAFGAQSPAITWAKEALMSDLRKELNISDDVHRMLLARVHDDKNIRLICSTPITPPPFPPLLPPSQSLPFSLPPLQSSGAPGGAGRGAGAGGVAGAAAPGALGGIAIDPLIGRRVKTRWVEEGGGSRFYEAVIYPRRGAGGVAGAAAPGALGGIAIDPLIGRRVKTRWVEEGGGSRFYEAVITDVRPEDGMYSLVYELNTPNESFEWVDLNMVRSAGVMGWAGVGENCCSAGCGEGVRGSIRR
ncbi:unnamed protein product [Closterium sp. Yama58-4]|nr:unnamed protein product [Closterium sp. Yama58-4]